jgi:hypothetical protein
MFMLNRTRARPRDRQTGRRDEDAF